MKHRAQRSAPGGRLPWLWPVLVLAAYGQDPFPDQRPMPYRVRSWQTDDGLPQNSVYALAQTPDGYLWVGTREGLAKFDGIRFTPPPSPADAALSRAWITALTVSADGALWVGTELNGLARLHNGVVSTFTRTNGLPADQIRCLFGATADGTVWIGTEEGLTAYQEGKFKVYTTRDGLPDNSIRGICAGGSGNIKVATKRGLSTFTRGGSFKATTFSGGWNRNALRCVSEDKQGNVWAGSTDGLHFLKGNTRAFYARDEGLPDPVINALLEDRSGQLWVGTYDGLVRIVNGRVIKELKRENAFGDLVYALQQDREGNIWVGARDGLYRLNSARFKVFSTEDGLKGNNVVSVCGTASGGMWIGVWGGGLHLLQADRITAYPDTNLLRDSILALGAAKDGTLWIGMDFAGGLQTFRQGVRAAFTNGAALIASPVQVIHEDNLGAIWVGTQSGLRLLRNGQVEGCSERGPATESITAICEDAKGAVWVGTEKGLSRWQDGEFENVSERYGLSHVPVTALYCDARGGLWAGTRGKGLRWIAGGSSFSLGTRQGLFSDEIYEIVEDDFGELWMSCRRGLFRMSKAELENVALGKKERARCTAFGKADGLASVQCNGVAKPAGWKDRAGQLWFPTIHGVVAVDTRIKTNARPPPLSIEEVWADKRRVEVDRGPQEPRVKIRPGHGDLQLVYTALSLQAPEKNRFKYRLEKVDSEWIEAGSQRSAHYNNVAPGTYRFRVIACNNDGVWNETGASLLLLLSPHFWQTWWFKVSIGMSCALVLFGLYQARMARLRELERLRVEIAANLHDDVGARLTKVAMITELVDRQIAETEHAKPHVRAIAGTTREIIQAMDEIVWTINPKNDTLENLANYIFRYAQEYFQHTPVRCRLDLPAQLPELAISTELRHHVFMVVKEVLNNILKHAAASEARISLAVDDRTMCISIADNGRGFDPVNARGKGEGLRNMKTRLAQLGGKLILESSPGKGTIVRLQVDAR